MYAVPVSECTAVFGEEHLIAPECATALSSISLSIAEERPGRVYVLYSTSTHKTLHPHGHDQGDNNATVIQCQLTVFRYGCPTRSNYLCFVFEPLTRSNSGMTPRSQL
jgi:hypothetical protein